MIHPEQPVIISTQYTSGSLLVLLFCSLIGCDDGGSATEKMQGDANVAPTRDASIINGPDTQNADAEVLDSNQLDVAPSDTSFAESDSDVDTPDASTAMPDVGPLPTECTVRIELNIPEGTDSTSPIYLAGNFCQNTCEADTSDCCDWTANDPQFTDILAERTPTQAYFEIRVPAFVDFEYKFTQGDWSRVEMNSACEDVPNRNLRAACPTGDQYQFTNTVSTWADVCR
ncbi:MAG: hypothetical protein ACPGQS_02020 [Bradymonadia bacterium]